MICYDVKQMLLILLKKWYVVLLGCMFWGVISIPLANISYERAVANYQKFYIAEQSEYNEIYSYAEGTDIDAFLTVLENAVLMETICQESESQYDWNVFKEKLEVQKEPTVNVLTVVANDVNEEEQVFLDNVFLKWVPEYLSAELEQEIVLQKMLRENVSAVEITERRDEIVSRLIKEPIRPASSWSVVMKACIFGFVSSCFCVMIGDYLKKCKTVE